MQIVGNQSGDLLSVQQAEPPVYDRRQAYPVTNRGYVRSGFVSPLEIRLSSIGAKSEVCNYKSLIVLGPERCAARRQRGEGPLHANVAESRPRSRHLLMARRR
jgi:hypothetical protein